MAIYHCTIKTGGRASGQSAIAASAYRSGTKMTDKETGIESNYTRKGGVVYSEVSLCENAPVEYAEREILWNAVHKIEKASNARLWREIEVALPHEFNRDEQIETVKEYVKGLTDEGMCADWSIHDKSDGNPHAHIMLTTRSIEADGKWAAKSRKVYDLDENGNKIYQRTDKNGRKQYKSHKEDYNNWNDRERIEEWREAWANVCNKHLSKEKKIDHRSYVRQGVEQIPTIHEGYIARQLAADGLPSERVQLNKEIRQKNLLLQRITMQLKTIGEEIKKLIAERSQEKGGVISAGKQRIADLLNRRSRAIDNSGRGITNGEREVESATGAEQISESTNAAAILRAADSIIEDTDTNREAVRKATADTDTLIRQSETKVESAAAHRTERDSARQRQAALYSQRIREEEHRKREASERTRKTGYNHSR